MDRGVFFTPEGLDKIEKEVEYLETVRCKEVAERIRVALGHGDLSGNLEYDETKDEQAHVGERITKLGNTVRSARVVGEDEINKDTVGVGTHVKVKDKKPGEENIFDIAGSAEADPLEGKTSNESSVGATLIDCKIDDVAEVEVSDGMIHYEAVETSP